MKTWCCDVHAARTQRPPSVRDGDQLTRSNRPIVPLAPFCVEVGEEGARMTWVGRRMVSAPRPNRIAMAS